MQKPDGVGEILWKLGTKREREIAYANRFRRIKMKSFPHYVEICVRCDVEFQKAEPASRHYPGCPATVGIEDIRIVRNDEKTEITTMRELLDYIMEKDGDEIEMASWEGE